MATDPAVAAAAFCSPQGFLKPLFGYHVVREQRYNLKQINTLPVRFSRGFALRSHSSYCRKPSRVCQVVFIIPFRKRWLPLAIPAQTALRQLKSYQDQTRKIPVLHWALIRGENDAAPDVSAVCRAVNEVGLRADVNIVRYNPYSTEYGEEASEQVIEERARQIGEELPGCRVKIVSRVGFDVQASCGMFVESLQREPIPTPVESLQAVAAGR